MKNNSRTKKFEENSGGVDNLVYTGFFEINHTKEPNCVCGQISYTVYRMINKNTKHIHWVGTCCINKYLETQGFGGKYGIKQGSYKQLYESVIHILSNVQIDYKLEKILEELRNGKIWNQTNKERLERICGCEIRFKTIDIKVYEAAYYNNEIFEKYGYSLEDYIKWRKDKDGQQF